MTKAYADLSEDAKQLDRQAKEYSRHGEYVQALTCYKQLTEREPQYANNFYSGFQFYEVQFFDFCHWSLVIRHYYK